MKFLDDFSASLDGRTTRDWKLPLELLLEMPLETPVFIGTAA
jgi:hypothetical protein